MKFFNLFGESKFGKSKPRHHMNVEGDFYVEKDACTLCGAPETEAMSLMSNSDEGCYFIRQPQTPEEIDWAINAVAASCVGAVRYGGTNQEIIKRLYELGSADECDYKLKE
jgi:hypothetical protein